MKKTITTLLLLSLSLVALGQNRWKWFLEPNYASILDFSEGYVAIQAGSKWGFVNHQGKTVIPVKYTAVASFSEGLAVAKLNKKSGFINKQGQVVIAFKPLDYNSFSNGRAVFFKASKKPNASPYETTYGYIDKKGKVIIPATRHINPLTSYTFSESMCVISDTKGWFMDINGKVLSTPRYGGVYEFSEGLAAVMDAQNSRWGFINKQGKFMISPTFYDVKEGFRENKCAVALRSKQWIYINKKGKQVFAQTFAQADAFSNGLAAVALQSKGKKIFGFINTTGKLAIPPKYEAYSYKPFSEGLAAVKQNGRWGFINKQGQMVIKAQFEEVGSFKEGKCRVRYQGKWGMIQKK